MTALTLATPEDIDRLLALVTAFHAEEHITLEAETRRAGLLPLLDGSPHGAAYLIGPRRSPIGYIVVSFGWSLEFAGLDGFIDELYIRPGVRGRGIGSEVLLALPKTLATAGLRAMHLEVRHENARARSLYERAHFKPRSDHLLMTRRF